ncbi:MAG: hypothetical protein ACI9WU_003391 [Myxococcota bacterium]|jgi:hypothetical protein
MHVLLALALAAAVASTGPDPTQANKVARVRAEIQVIHATRGDKFVDPSLKSLKRYLENSFGTRYQSFKLLGKSSMPLSRAQRQTQKLPNETELALTFLGTQASRLRLLMEVGGMKTTVKVHDGGLFFQAGRRYKAGMLVVAIRVHALQ